MKPGRINVLVASVLMGLAGWCGVGITAAYAAPAQDSTKDEHAGMDMLIFRSGTIQYGKIIAETATSVTFMGSTAGIEFTTDYPKSDILEIKKAKKAGETTPGTNDKTPVDIRPAQKPAAAAPDDGIAKKNVYWVDLTGEFGEDISESPIRNVMKDAHKAKADVVIFRLDADFKNKDGIEDKNLTNDYAQFDALFRCEKIMPVFSQEMSTEWGNDPTPRIVFWVKQAMAGAAFLPFISKEIYFTSDARMGGIGNLATIFKGVGDYRVQEKQRSLRLAHAEGWANYGGYDYRIIRAMARIEYVLSVRYVNGKPELFEGYPSNPGEELLTDDGEGEHADTLQERVSGEGNDVLTLTARTAKIVGVSKGTVDTKEELLAAMGLDRTGVIIPAHSKQIMADWSKGLDTAKAQMKKLFSDYREVRVQPPNDYNARTKARGTQLRILDEIKGLIQRWGEGLAPWLQENGIPGIPDIETRQEQIKIDQMKDKR